MLIAGTLLCAVGVLDDLFELDALTKLGGQVLAAALLIASGIQFVFFTWTDERVFSLDPLQSALLTGLLVVATVNAVNFVDGLDGLAGGVVAIGALSFFLFCYQLTRLNEPAAGHHRRAAQRRAGRGVHRVPGRTTSTRPGCSWATAARC